MSVTPDDIHRLPRHTKPKTLGGRSDNPVFRISCAVLPKALFYAADRRYHGSIEPAQQCQFDEYQANLHETRMHWEQVDI